MDQLTEIINKDLFDFQYNNMMIYYEKAITDRAVPDVQDSLKPIHRRLLYSMLLEGATSNKKFMKSARITGSAMKFHPHGDSYPTLTNLIVEHSNNQPLVQGHGAFHNIQGDPSASNRYTEARLNKFSEEFLLEGVRDNIVDFKPSFDQDSVEPVVLPAKLPLIFVNGAYGIAAGGISSSIPPHSMESVINSTIDILENPDKDIKDIIKDNKLYPDFPYGGVMDTTNIIKIYTTGSGSIPVRATMHLDDSDKKVDKLIITEIPYLKRLNRIKEEIKDKKESFTGLVNMQDATSKGNVKLILSYLKGTDMASAEAKLYSLTPLQATFPVSMNLVKNGKLVMYKSVKDIFNDWIEFRHSTIKRQKMITIRNLEKRIHILDGLIKVLNDKNIDKLIKSIKNGGARLDIIDKLVVDYSLTEMQASFIADIKLYNISKLESSKFIDERADKKLLIEGEIKYLKDTSILNQYIIDELREISKSKHIHVKARHTTYENGFALGTDREAVVPDEEFILLATKQNFIKKIPVSSSKAQKKNGKGLSIGKIKDNDLALAIVQSHSKDNVLFITTDGYIYKYKCYDIPTNKSISTLGTNISPLIKNKNLAGIITLSDEEFNNKDASLVVSTMKNTIKTISMEQFSNLSKSGIILSKIRENDQVISIEYLNQDNYKIIGLRKDGFIIQIDSSTIPSLMRTTYGPKLFRDNDHDVVTTKVVYDDSEYGFIVVTDAGLGKWFNTSEYTYVQI